MSLPDKDQSYPFTTSIDVRVYDLVGGVHVGNQTLIAYINEAQMQLFKQLGFADLIVNGLMPINRHIEVSYMAEAKYGDSLTVSVAINEFAENHYQSVFKVEKNHSEKNVCVAAMQMMFIDIAKGGKAPVPGEFIEAYKRLN